MDKVPKEQNWGEKARTFKMSQDWLIVSRRSTKHSPVLRRTWSPKSIVALRLVLTIKAHMGGFISVKIKNSLEVACFGI